MNAIYPSTDPTFDSINTSGSEPQGPVPAPCPQGHSPARPSSSAVGPLSTRGICATYDPADDKIRISASSRLDNETYKRVKAAGFSWAPKQGVFYAVWSPEREDVATELAGQIGDEDTTLAERAEARAERFDGYQERRAADAEGARKAVAAISDNIPLGQPILVGHHSERHARRDAERIRSGMQRAVNMWRTAEYWQRRAAGALAHASYKELPAVRARRIKGLESDGRKYETDHKRATHALALWTKLHEPDSLKRKDGQPTTFLDRALHVADMYAPMGTWSDLRDGKATPEQAQAICIASYTAALERYSQWVEHIANRLTYERAMLADGGGLAADKFDLQPGGRILRRGKWYPIAKVNRRDGVALSVTVVGHFATTVQVEEITEYRAPDEGDAEKVKAAIDKGPLCNFPGEKFKHMTKADWDKRPKWSDAPTTRTIKATEEHGRHRLRVLYRAGFEYDFVYLTDAKCVDRPAAPSAPTAPIAPETDTASLRDELFRRESAAANRTERDAEAAPFEAIAKSLKAGVQVVTAPQLFPTPTELAARMVAKLRPVSKVRVLEPSAGTGRLLDALAAAAVAATGVEIDPRLASALAARFGAPWVICADFLALSPDDPRLGGLFDGVVMNPPFVIGQDIAHIRHALTFLAPGGVLVALCADGPRQREQLKPEIEAVGGTWEALGDVGFAGTSVRVAMLTVQAPA